MTCVPEKAEWAPLKQLHSFKEGESFSKGLYLEYGTSVICLFF